MGSVLGGIADALTFDMFDFKGTGEMSDVDDPKTAKELQAKANKDAEKKRLAREGGRDTKGKTMFSDPLVNAGMPLKEKLGV